MSAGLLGAIPGLSVHQMQAPPAVAPAFDSRRALFVMRNALSVVASTYQTGCMEWLRENRSDVVAFLRECEQGVDAAMLAEDMPRLTLAVEKYVAAYRRAFGVYVLRPPVVEIDPQGGLF